MIIKSVQGVNFRNYSWLQLSVDKMINIFFGHNAQGKTNILECIFYAAFGLSHRTNQEDNLFTFGSEQMMVKVEFANSDDNHYVQIKKYAPAGERGRKEAIIDNNKHTLKNYYGFLNVVMFSPEDLQIVKGEPGLRRRFIDMQISQTDKRYLDLLVKYNKILRQRNTLLKQIREGLAPEDILDSWDEGFIALAVPIYEARISALSKLERIAKTFLYEISQGEHLTIQYLTKGLHKEISDAIPNYKEFVKAELSASRDLDIIRGTTNIGPHRDDISLMINDLFLKNYGSQGQQRSVALALKLSQLEYVKEEIGEYPVLLLDDVMSELDAGRRSHLLKFIDGRVQTFVTVNDRSLIPDDIKADFFLIENGTISKV